MLAGKSMDASHLPSAPRPGRLHRRRAARTPGFSLIITIALMVLLSLLAVGLLSLSTISMRSSKSGEAQGVARSNARMALVLALGDLQRKVGPDQRITAPANLSDPSLPRGVSGVWESWKPDPAGVTDEDYRQRKGAQGFLGYLMSNPEPGGTSAPGELPSGDASQVLVGAGTLGSDTAEREVRAPLILTDRGEDTAMEGGFAWVALDESFKARMDLAPAREAEALGEQVAQVGAPARNRFESVPGLEFLAEDDDSRLREELPKLASFKQVELRAGSRSELGERFHDYTVYSNSLQTNVAEGGLKTDLSVLFDGGYGDELPGDYEGRFVYSNAPEPFPDGDSNGDVPWSLYANYARLYRLDSSAQGNGLDGLRARPPSSMRLTPVRDGSASPAVTRYEPRMESITEPILMPTVIRVDTMFSLVVRRAHQGRGTSQYPYQLHLMYLPVITLHNPFNTPLRCANLQVEFSDIPLGFEFVVNGRPTTTSGLVPLNRLYMGSVARKTFSVTLSDSLTANREVVMGPGETRIFGTPFSPTATWSSELESNGRVMFDWANNQTSDVRMIPGMITGPTDGIGFDVDWLAPDPRASWVNARRNEGVLLLSPNDRIEVRFGPTEPAAAEGVFSVTTKMANREFARTQVFYKNETTLDALFSEGISPRFPESREFPISYPGPGSAPIQATQLLEQDGTPFRSYVRARPFAVFSVGAKTTVESFTKARPVADNGIAFQMATCDFRETVSQGASPLEFALVPIKNGSSAIESDGDKGFYFGGHGSTNGTTAATIYEVPLAPLQSIAQLRHANAASIFQEPLVTYSVGESRAHPALPSDQAYLQEDRSKLVLDHAWLANSTLWDGYWFSTLSSLDGPAYDGASGVGQRELAEAFFAGERDLPNPRNVPHFPVGRRSGPEELAGSALDEEGRRSAAHLMTQGGFNVNSTSVEAWTAVLSALSEGEIPLAGGEVEASPDPSFPRVRRPVFGQLGGAATPKEKLWNSYRSLSDDEVRELSESIVDEVRARGPFLSMAEFVNRRLGTPGEFSRSGTLQAALDRSGVNEIMEFNARPVDGGEVADYGWRNPDAVTGNTGAGAAGEISQGDLLTLIGSFATVRADTFVVRAYGDARDPNGRVLARAVCEATVQRVPEYVDATDTPESLPSTPANEAFGRQLRVVAFRWLAPLDV